MFVRGATGSLFCVWKKSFKKGLTFVATSCYYKCSYKKKEVLILVAQKQNKDYMLRVRMTEKDKMMLEFIEQKEKKNKSIIVREGIELKYKSLKKS